MKKIIFILTAFFLFLQINGFSQKSRVGISGGVSIANMSKSFNGTKTTGDRKTGVMGGLIVEFPLAKHFVLQSGIYYVQKGKINKKTNPNSTDHVSTALRYAELPVNVLYKTNGSYGTFYFGGGPAISLNFPSKIVTKSNGKTTFSDITFGNTSGSTLRGVDYGINATAGFRFPFGIFISANFCQGLRNLVPGGSEDTKIHNNYFGIQLGYLFKPEKK
jgi:hypothetical protein